MIDSLHPSGRPGGDRSPLEATSLRRALVGAGSPWTGVEVVEATGSTNADLARAAVEGRAAAGTVLVAEQQRAGRGRLDRSWVSPPRAGLTFSVLLAPVAPAARWAWLPLLAGLAAGDGVASATGVQTRLKWPNDLMAVDGRKVGGVLSERVEARGTAYAVLGLGLNVMNRPDELPVATAASLAMVASDAEAAARVGDRERLLASVLGALAGRVAAWEAGADPREDYRATCATLGRAVRVELSRGMAITGTAVDVDEVGRLVVARDPGGDLLAVSAGDVMHLR